jgi:hypothetical protein
MNGCFSRSYFRGFGLKFGKFENPLVRRSQEKNLEEFIFFALRAFTAQAGTLPEVRLNQGQEDQVPVQLNQGNQWQIFDFIARALVMARTQIASVVFLVKVSLRRATRAFRPD